MTKRKSLSGLGERLAKPGATKTGRRERTWPPPGHKGVLVHLDAEAWQSFRELALRRRKPASELVGNLIDAELKAAKRNKEV